MGVAAGLVVGVFARWVAGVWCVRCGVGAWVGWWGALCLAALPWSSLGAHVPRVGVLAWAVVLCAGLGGKGGAGQCCPAPRSVVALSPPLRGVGGEG